MANDKIQFEASFDQNKKCILIDGQGVAEIKFTTDAQQLPPVLTALAMCKECTFMVEITPLKKSNSLLKPVEEGDFSG